MQLGCGAAARKAAALGALAAACAVFAAPAQAATYTVGTTADPTPVPCTPASGTCSLRELISFENGNAASASDTIVVPAGSYTLANGELLITASITIAGAGARTTSVNETPTTPARVFDIQVPSGGSAPTVTISGLEIDGGTASASNGFDGGDVRNAGNLTLSEDWVTSGTANDGGGASDDAGGTLTVTHSLVSGNATVSPVCSASCTGEAGGIWSGADSSGGPAVAKVVVDSSTVAANTSQFGGGVMSVGNESSVTIANSTIAGNDGGSFGSSGGGLLAYQGGAISIGNSIVAGNTVDAPTTGTPSNCGATGTTPGTIASDGYNLESGTDCGFTATGDLQNTGPQFTSTSPQNNGGNTDTLALGPESPAIDQIPPGAPAGCGGTDQRDVTRPIGGGCDIGAYEAAQQTFAETEGAGFTIVLANDVCGFFSGTVDWGDGNSSAASFDSTTSNVSGTHTYAEESTYDGTLTWSNDCGTHALHFIVVVADAALTPSGTSFNATAGAPFRGTVATFTDGDPAGAASDYTATIAWGDGSTATTGTVSANAGGGFSVTGLHTYAAAGSYTVTVQIADAGGANAGTTSTATVGAERSLSATEGAALTGQVAAGVTGCTPTSASVTWGDGSSSGGTIAGAAISGTHTYSEEGTFNGSASWKDSCGQSLSSKFLVVVSDAALSDTGANFSASASAPVRTTVATFTDADPGGTVSDYSAKINWGDGTIASVGTIGAGFKVTGQHVYAHAGTFTTAVTIRDAGGAVRSVTGTATVGAERSLSATEGAALTGQVAAGVNGCAPTSATVAWGDGTSSGGTISAAAINGTHTYAEEGTFNGTASWSDGCGQSLSSKFLVVVSDAALSDTGANFSASATAPVRTTVATFTDADPGGTVSDYSAKINWGDGTIASVGTIGAGFKVTGQHVYAHAGTFTTAVTIRDAGGAVRSVTGKATVGAVPSLSATEGAALTARVAAGVTGCTPTSATVTWGDGATSPGAFSGLAIDGTHTYAEEGAYNGSVAWNDSCGQSLSSKFTMAVADAKLSATGESIPAQPGTSFTAAVAKFTDADPGGTASDYTATISWGDGSTSPGAIHAGSGGAFFVSGAHTYATAASRTTSITITDAGGAHVTAGGSANVAAPPTIHPVEATAFTGQVATPFPDCAPTSATVTWGDGQSSAATLSATAISGSHTYAEEGSYTGSVTWTDACHFAHTAAFASHVGDAPLSVLGFAVSATPGSPFATTVASFTDADPGGTASDYNATIAWGDGSTSPGVISAGGGGGLAVSGAHTYAAPGAYTLTVSVLDGGGASAASSSTATVASAPPAPSTPAILQTTGAPVVGSTTSAAFSATIDPDGLATTVHFEYGPDFGGAAAITYGLSTPDQSLPGDFLTHTVTATVTDLFPNTTYHVRVVATNSAGSVPGGDEVLKTPADPPPPPPVLGKEVDVAPVSGLVFFKLPAKKAHSSALIKGKDFVPLTEARQLPVGTQVDARQGTLKLVSAAGVKKHTYAGNFSTGLFQILQSLNRKARGLTTLKLIENAFPGAPSFSQCAAVGKSASAAKAKHLSSRVLQLLHSSVHGHFQTQGRYSAATVRGTVWDTSDRCDGTLTAVHRGTVLVTDFRRRVTVAVTAGKSYLARAQ